MSSRRRDDSDEVEAYQTMVRGVAQAYPGDLNLPAVSTVMAAMAQRYPCR
jgi:hypothetical protein